MKIRTAVKADLPVIEALYRQQFDLMGELQPYLFQPGDQSKDFIGGAINGEDTDILLLERQGVTLGFVLIQEKETVPFPFAVPHRFAYVMDILVDKSSRTAGCGSRLMEAARKWAIARGLDYLELDVLSNNTPALQFYEKQGFAELRKTLICTF